MLGLSKTLLLAAIAVQAALCGTLPQTPIKTVYLIYSSRSESSRKVLAQCTADRLLSSDFGKVCFVDRNSEDQKGLCWPPIKKFRSDAEAMKAFNLACSEHGAYAEHPFAHLNGVQATVDGGGGQTRTLSCSEVDADRIYPAFALETTACREIDVSRGVAKCTTYPGDAQPETTFDYACTRAKKGWGGKAASDRGTVKPN
ncbi:hypothetical protein ACQY0O_007500 [Thecaphora frezii]